MRLHEKAIRLADILDLEGCEEAAHEALQIAAALTRGYYLIDQLECLAVESHPALYEAAKAWREEVGR